MGFPTHILTKMIRVEINVRAVFAGTRARVLSDKGPIEVRSNDLRDPAAHRPPHFFPLTNSTVWPLSLGQPIKPTGQQRLENPFERQYNRTQ